MWAAICTVLLMAVLEEKHSLSVTAAHSRGISGLLKDAEAGSDIVVERHGRPVAAIVSVRRLDELAALEADLRSAVVVLSRAATDTGERTDLDTAIAALGFDRRELEAELDAELTAGPDSPRE